ncbi:MULTISPECIES: efflux RND transporter periplasmic adaptor subunit [Ferrimonas]|uniref:efflux RND transporter periplasmic adaptor subunit n=1 Tax=Ferrimonas TaxID=44011 RepID=UPI000421B7F9|nr:MULTISPECIES: efflux RND transporter periplasmic adaptor subunit [Ferrimonas]USD36420.1 efflux RND transporter periplasmic adaptor subunit [Ferrimonas sp. SCSIO 43195]
MKKTIVAGVLLSLALGSAVYYKESGKADPGQRGQRPMPSVVVTDVVREPMRREVEALGTVKARESVVLSVKVTETVEAVHFEDGQIVEADTLLVTLRDGEQQAKLRAAKANLQEQNREYNRIKGLVKAKTIASSELDKRATSIDVARATLAQYQAELDARYLRSPFKGVLGFREVSPGALVTPGTEVTTLDDIDVVKLDFPVPERFLSRLKKGREVEATAAAFPGRVFTGTVASIDSRIDPVTRALVVRANIDNRDLALRPGMLMTLKLITEQRDTLVVPEEAIIPLQQRHYLFVVNADNKIEQREVEVGLRVRGKVEILSGVDGGEQVVTRGIMKVRPGQEVKTRTSERFSVQGVG